MDLNYQDINNIIQEEGLCYFLLGYTDSDIMPDENGKKLFEETSEALEQFENYVNSRIEENK